MSKKYSPIFVSNDQCNITNWLPESNNKMTNMKTDSWYDAKYYENPIQNNNDRSCGIDLGICSFVTIYSPNKIYSMGNEVIHDRSIVNLHKKIDSITYRLKFEKLNPRKKGKLRRGLKKYQDVIFNKMADMHYKIINYLINTFDNVYIGKFNENDILNNTDVNPETKRILLELKPQLFIQRLKETGSARGLNVVEINEYLSTKTCSNCGKTWAIEDSQSNLPLCGQGMINHIGKNKIYDCSCGIIVDRDINSAKTHLKIGLVTNH